MKFKALNKRSIPLDRVSFSVVVCGLLFVVCCLAAEQPTTNNLQQTTHHPTMIDKSGQAVDR
jgi:hypothetical protein